MDAAPAGKGVATGVPPADVWVPPRVVGGWGGGGGVPRGGAGGAWGGGGLRPRGPPLGGGPPARSMPPRRIRP
ncbi:hypothetical protein [Nocardia asiatica]|uniref:hypothetical protein n=1 Tax=Nocardia asiatica TaxID=209252 RepID=UPI0024563706|nr:hypothetical protein [Nocardia asiatica]